MRAVIIRHGKVDFQWKKWSTSKQFDEDCIMYDEAPIFPLLTDGLWIDYKNIYISSLRRSRETANQLFGEKDFISTKLIDEVPLCASITSSKKLPLIFWNVSGRLQWFFNIHSQKECRRETIYRAEQFIEMIIKREADCIIVTHGFFMHTLLNQMKKTFQISHTRLNYSNGEYIIAERKIPIERAVLRAMLLDRQVKKMEHERAVLRAMLLDREVKKMEFEKIDSTNRSLQEENKIE